MKAKRFIQVIKETNDRMSRLVEERKRLQQKEESIIFLLYTNTKDDIALYVFTGSMELYDFFKKKLTNDTPVKRREGSLNFEFFNVRQYLYNGIVKIDCKLLYENN